MVGLLQNPGVGLVATRSLVTRDTAPAVGNISVQQKTNLLYARRLPPAHAAAV
jgi:hypothetical protein